MITEFLSNLEYPLWTYIVEILCIGGIALGVLFLFFMKFIQELQKQTKELEKQIVAQ